MSLLFGACPWRVFLVDFVFMRACCLKFLNKLVLRFGVLSYIVQTVPFLCFLSLSSREEIRGQVFGKIDTYLEFIQPTFELFLFI